MRPTCPRTCVSCQACTVVSVVSLVAWLDGHEATELGRLSCMVACPRSGHCVARWPGRDQLLALHGCLAEIRSLSCTVTWPRSVAGVARLLGRDQVTDPHGCLAEIPKRHAPGCKNVCFCCLPLFGASTVPWLWKKFWKSSRSLLLP